MAHLVRYRSIHLVTRCSCLYLLASRSSHSRLATPLSELTLLARVSETHEDMEAGISFKSLLEQAVKQLAKIEDPAILTFREGKRGAVTITDGDVLSLEPTSSLSSNIVDFYIKYLEEEKLPSNNREQYYFFSSIFFEKLVGTRSASTDIEYDKVRNMTGEVDLFEKDYIFIPIHEDMHWSLIIIYNLSSLRIPPADEHKGLPRILHLDSDNGSHLLDSNGKGHASFLEQRIVRYILSAWTERYRNPSVDQLLALSELKRVEVKVAQLDNDFDSAVYLLHLMELFLEKAASTDRVGGFQLESHFTQRDSADPVGRSREAPFTYYQALAKRNHIKNLILKLSGMTQLQLTLRFNYCDILSWLKGEAIPEGPIKALHNMDLTTLQADADAVVERRDEILSDDEQHVHVGYGLMHETARMGQRWTEFVHASQQADVEVAPVIETHQKHKMKRKNSEEASEVPVRKDAEVERGKEKRARARDWSKEESFVLLSCVAEGNQFLKGNFIDWDLISQVIQKEFGSVRTRMGCQGRFDTIWRVYKTARIKYSVLDSRDVDEISRELATATSLPGEWCRFLEVHFSRKALRKRAVLTNVGGNGSVSWSPCNSPPRSSNDVGTESDPIGGFLDDLLEVDPSQAKVPHGIYKRSVKAKQGSTQSKFEPRFRPPREKPPSGRPKYLYFGQYDTVEEARAVYQIAAFYYGMSDGVLDLGDGHNFIIPPMESEESRLSGDEKRQWVKRKVRRVYEEAKAKMMGVSLAIPDGSIKASLNTEFTTLLADEVVEFRDEIVSDEHVHAGYGLMDETAQMGQHGTEIVHVSQQADAWSYK